MLDVDLRHFPSKIYKAKTIALLGNGGNLAVAQHMASDIFLIAPVQHDTLDTLVIPARTYHEFECNALWNIYRLLESTGVELPNLPHIS